MPLAGFLATQGKRRLRSRFLTAMSKTAVHGARTPYYGDAHIAPFTPAPAVPNLSLATSAGECARGYFVGDILAQRANVCVMQTAAVRLLRTHELSDFVFATQNR